MKISVFGNEWRVIGKAKLQKKMALYLKNGWTVYLAHRKDNSTMLVHLFRNGVAKQFFLMNPPQETVDYMMTCATHFKNVEDLQEPFKEYEAI